MSHHHHASGCASGHGHHRALRRVLLVGGAVVGAALFPRLAARLLVYVLLGWPIAAGVAAYCARPGYTWLDELGTLALFAVCMPFVALPSLALIGWLAATPVEMSVRVMAALAARR